MNVLIYSLKDERSYRERVREQDGGRIDLERESSL